LSYLEFAESLVESGSMEDLIEAAENVDAAKDLFDTMKSLDLSVINTRLKRVKRKIERYFGG
jgi:hypothetical protein